MWYSKMEERWSLWQLRADTGWPDFVALCGTEVVVLARIIIVVMEVASVVVVVGVALVEARASVV